MGVINQNCMFDVKLTLRLIPKLKKKLNYLMAEMAGPNQR